MFSFGTGILARGTDIMVFQAKQWKEKAEIDKMAKEKQITNSYHLASLSMKSLTEPCLQFSLLQLYFFNRSMINEGEQEEEGLRA